MNKHSSRSHCIFTVNVQITTKEGRDTVNLLGKLHMVDLAGSECAKTASIGSENPSVSSVHLFTSIFIPNDGVNLMYVFHIILYPHLPL